MMDYRDEEQPKHLSEYYFVLLKHKWLIFAVLAVAVGLVVIHNYRAKPVYRATATMVIESQRRRSPISGQVIDFEGYYLGALAFNTHCTLITSRPVMERVLRELQAGAGSKSLDQPPGLLARITKRIKQNVRVLIGKKANGIHIKEGKDNSIQPSLSSRIYVRPVKDTRILRVNVEDTDPEIAQKTANLLAKAYIEFDIENHMKSSRNTLSWMTEQLYGMKKKLEDAEAEFLAFKQKEKVFSISGKREIIAQKIQDFNDAYLKARNRRLEIDARLAQITKNAQDDNGFYVRSLLQNSVISSLYTQILDLELQRSRLAKVFKFKHPKMIQITADIENSKKRLQEEVRKEIDNLRSERSVLLAREAVFQKTIDEFEREALEMNRKESRYRILERNVQTYQKLYNTLLEKVKESNVVKGIDLSNIRIAETASLPRFPIRPNKVRNITMGVVFGLLLGIGLGFFWEYLDRSIRSEDDVEEYFSLPVLSIIPASEGRKGKKAERDAPS